MDTHIQPPCTFPFINVPCDINAIFAQCSNVNVKKFNKVRVNGGSKHDCLKDALQESELGRELAGYIDKASLDWKSPDAITGGNEITKGIANA